MVDRFVGCHCFTAIQGAGTVDGEREMESSLPKPAKPLRILIAGGGTGGHIYPGIAIARETRRRHPDAELLFVGTERGLEVKIVPAECGDDAGLLGAARLAFVSDAGS